MSDSVHLITVDIHNLLNVEQEPKHLNVKFVSGANTIEIERKDDGDYKVSVTARVYSDYVGTFTLRDITKNTKIKVIKENDGVYAVLNNSRKVEVLTSRKGWVKITEWEEKLYDTGR